MVPSPLGAVAPSHLPWVLCLPHISPGCCASLRITLLPNGTLRIANVTKRDSASYTCIARNQFGSASTTGMLLVTGEEDAFSGP